jgi:tol-pal system protein YbgF
MSVRSVSAACGLSLGIAIAASAPGNAQNNADLALRLERLESQIRDITGLIDALTYQVEQLQSLVNALLGNAGTQAEQGVAQVPPAGAPLVLGNVVATPQQAGAGAPLDLTQAIRPGGDFNIAEPATDAPAIVPPAAENGVAAGQAVTMTGNRQADYDVAYQLVLNGDYALAEEAFASFLRSYPGSDLAVDAQFWLAESMFSRGMYLEAANEFYDAFVDNTEHPKAPDMLLKLGISLAQLGQLESACDVFIQVSARYPDASNAILQRVATERANAGC